MVSGQVTVQTRAKNKRKQAAATALVEPKAQDQLEDPLEDAALEAQTKQEVQAAAPADPHENSAPSDKPSTPDRSSQALLLGTAGSPTQLPHLARLQTAFGRYGLGGVLAYTDPSAKAAADSLDAMAFASGEQVILGEQDLFTVAHEAAHVVQQRHGVQGGARWEDHADAVAHAVLAGASAEPLLAAIEGAGELSPNTLTWLDQEGQGQGDLDALAAETQALLDGSLSPAFPPQAHASPESPVQLRDSSATASSPALSELHALVTEASSEADTRKPERKEEEPAAPSDPELELPSAPQPAAQAPPVDTSPAPAAPAARAAVRPAKEKPELSGDTADALVSNFVISSPTAKAQAWVELGARVDKSTKTETTRLSKKLPTLQAEIFGDGTKAPSDPVQSPSTENDSITEPQGPLESPVLPAPQALGGFVATGSTPRIDSSDPNQAAKSVGRAIGSVSTRDTALSTSAGPAPSVPLTGATDPQQLIARHSEAAEKRATAKASAQQAVLNSPGSERVQLQELLQDFTPSPVTLPQAQATAPQDKLNQYIEFGLPANVQESFDQLQGPDMAASLQAADAQAKQARIDRDSSFNKETDLAESRTASANAEAQLAQQREINTQRAAIAQGRAATFKAQQSAVQTLEDEAAAEYSKQSAAVQERITTDQERINNEYAKAETKAKAEQRAGDARAKEEKRKSETAAEDESWWDQATSFVSDCIESLKSAVSAIFDAVRQAVTEIFDSVRSLANSIIDGACKFIKDGIRALGNLLKSAIDMLLGDIFPELAEKLNALVEAAVDAAVSAVDAIAEDLKKGIAAVLDTLEKAVNALVSLFEATINLALTSVDAILTGDWGQLLRMALEAALSVAGISPEEFYAMTGDAEATLQSILDNPGSFLGNLLEAVSQGFSNFSSNFTTHLQEGFLEWLTGVAGDAKIAVPDAFDLKGVFSIASQVLGIDKEMLEAKVEKHFGERASKAFRYVWDSVEALIADGPQGLFDKIMDDLGGLADTVMGQLIEYLSTTIITKAVLKIASMFNPIGAIVQVILTAWNLYEFLRDQIHRIMGVVQSVVTGFADIASGSIGAAVDGIESALANMVPVAIDLLAKLLGLGGVGKKVRSVIEGIHERIDKALDNLITKLKGLFPGDDSADSGGETTSTDQDEGEFDWDGELGKIISFLAGGETHKLWITPTGEVMVASTPMTVTQRLDNWTTRTEELDDQGKSSFRDLKSKAQTSYDEVSKRAALTKNKSGSEKLTADEALTLKEGTLAAELKALFDLFGDETGHAGVGEGLAAVHPVMMTPVRKAQASLSAPPENWNEMKAQLATHGDVQPSLSRPTNKDTVFGGGAGHALARDAVEVAVATHKDDTPVPTRAKEDPDGYASSLKATRLHQGAPHKALKRTIWDGSAANESAAIDSMAKVLQESFSSASTPKDLAADLERYRARALALGVSIEYNGDVEVLVRSDVQAFADRIQSEFLETVDLSNLRSKIVYNSNLNNKTRGSYFEAWLQKAFGGTYKPGSPKFVTTDGSTVIADGYINGTLTDSGGATMYDAKSYKDESPPSMKSILGYKKLFDDPDSTWVSTLDGTEHKFSFVRFILPNETTADMWHKRCRPELTTHYEIQIAGQSGIYHYPSSTDPA